MSLYVHLCCSMGDILIIQKLLVGWNFDKCPFMLQYGWYFDNSKDFSGMKIWKISIYVHLCCSMGDFFIIQTNQKKTSSRIEKIFYVHLWDILCTRFFSIPEDALKRNFFQFYILCTSSFLYIYIYIYIYIYLYIFIYLYIYILHV